MRHPAVLFFWGLVAAAILWGGVAAMTAQSGRWSARPGMMGSDLLLAGPGARGPMHVWGGAPYVLSPTGGSPQIGDVEHALNDWLAREGNPRLKLGLVSERDANRFQADIVTKDGSLVQRFDIDRRSGLLAPMED